MPVWLRKASYWGLAAAAGWVPICLSVAVWITNEKLRAPGLELFQPRAPELWTMILPSGAAVAFIVALAASALLATIKPVFRARRIRQRGKIDIREWMEGLAGTRIELDGSHWASKGDFYDALLPAIGAPPWHGRNLAALNQSIRAGKINDIRPPYTVRIRGAATMQPDAREMVNRFAELLAERRAEGIPVGVVVVE